MASKFRGLPCVACGDRNTVGDHIKAFKRLASHDVEFNLWPLCVFGSGNGHHEEKEQIGLTQFAKKYGLEEILLSRGFDFCYLRKKWFHPKLD